MPRYTKSRYTKVGVCIWSDDRFLRLTPLEPSGQALWLYLITCPAAESVPGLIPMGRLALSESLGWSPEAFDKAFAEIEAEGIAMADWRSRMIWVPKAINHNPPGNVNILKHWFAELEKVPAGPLKEKAVESLGEFCKANGEGFAKAFQEAFPQALSKALPKTFDEALPKAFGNSNSNSNSETHTPCVESGDEKYEARPEARDRRNDLILPPLALEELTGFTPEVQQKAWHWAHRYRDYCPGSRGATAMGKASGSLADVIIDGGEWWLEKYFSVTDPEELEAQVKSGMRCPLKSGPWEITKLYFRLKGDRRRTQSSVPELPDANDFYAAKVAEFEAVKKVEQAKGEAAHV